MPPARRYAGTRRLAPCGGCPAPLGRNAAQASTVSRRRRMRRTMKMTKVLKYGNVLTARVSDADFRAVCERADEEGAHPLRVPPLHSAPRGRRRRERAARRRAARRALHAEALPRARQVGAPLQPGDARPQLHQVRARPRKGRPGVGVRQARRVRAAARPGGRRARGHREEHLLARGARHRWRRLKCRS